MLNIKQESKKVLEIQQQEASLKAIIADAQITQSEAMNKELGKTIEQLTESLKK